MVRHCLPCLAVISRATWARVPLQPCVRTLPAQQQAGLPSILGGLTRGRCCNRVNITLGPKEERLLMTGLHTVADIYCTCCNTTLGWKYVRFDRHPVCLTELTAHLPCTASACMDPNEAPFWCSLQERAFEESQKYKEGKFILEKAKLMKVCTWTPEVVRSLPVMILRHKPSGLNLSQVQYLQHRLHWSLHTLGMSWLVVCRRAIGDAV